MKCVPCDESENENAQERKIKRKIKWSEMHLYSHTIFKHIDRLMKKNETITKKKNMFIVNFNL